MLSAILILCLVNLIATGWIAWRQSRRTSVSSGDTLRRVLSTGSGRELLRERIHDRLRILEKAGR